MNIIAFIYSFIHGSNVWKYLFNKDVTFRGAFLKHTKLYVQKGAQLYIGPKCQINNSKINVMGGAIRIKGCQTCINNTMLLSRIGSKGISIGEDFSMQGGSMQCAEGSQIKIGSHCMFSGGIEILSGDLHTVLDIKSNNIINNPKDITIGDHVWLAAHVKIMKDVKIASNTIVGHSSLVNKELNQPHSIYAGIPAKMVKTGVDWRR